MARRAGPIVVALMVAGAFVGVTPANAQEELYQSKTYHISNGLAAASAFGINAGGVWFTGPPTVPTRVSAIDRNGTPVRLRVAQDTNNNFQYGDPGEPNAVGCGTADLSTSKAPFKAGQNVAVFISLVYVGCTALGTTGTIDLFVSVP